MNEVGQIKTVVGNDTVAPVVDRRTDRIGVVGPGQL